MEKTIDTCLILLTYKGKVLLMHQDNILINPLDQLWKFIGGNKKKGATIESTIINIVEKETSIKLANVQFLSTWLYKQRKKHFFRAELTDAQVNNITRNENQVINFFTLKELQYIKLEISTQLFLLKHKSLFHHELPLTLE